MADALQVSVALMWILVGAGLTWLLSIIMNERGKRNRGIMLNFDSKKSHGRFIGLVKETVWGAGGRGKVTYEPKGVDLDKLKKAKLKLQDEEIIVAPHKFFVFSPGTLDNDATIYMNLPHRFEDLPEELKHTPFGVGLQYVTVTQDFVKKRVEILQTKIKNRDELLDEVGDAEMTEELISRIKGFNKDLAEMMIEAKESTKKKSFDYTPQSGGQPHN